MLNGEDAWDEATPEPGALIESLRSFGYNPQTALADLVDNSVSAGATKIDLVFDWNHGEPFVSITDDGAGMSEPELINAMRPGSLSPLAHRLSTDLGRFGLGLKTASFSQARELTVSSRQEGGSSTVRRWDLDVVNSTSQWRLMRTPSAPAASIAETADATHGTTVVWTKCDRLCGEATTESQRAEDRFLRIANEVKLHLGITFHRFLTGAANSAKKKISITVNGNEVSAWDPVLKHPATHMVSSPEFVSHGGQSVKITPYVLPHRSKLSAEEQEAGKGIRGWNSQQGFYVYRSDRMLVAGDWLGLKITKDEHTKLARIIVDFDASQDLDWQIDVKKSTARPPSAVLSDLRRIAAATRREAEEVYRHRGTVLRSRKDRELVFAWREYKERDGELKLRLNRNHPVIVDALLGSTEHRQRIERLIRFVEETVPTTLIGVRVAESLDKQRAPYDGNSAELRTLLDEFVEITRDKGESTDSVLNRLVLIEPFSSHPEIVQVAREQTA